MDPLPLTPTARPELLHASPATAEGLLFQKRTARARSYTKSRIYGADAFRRFEFGSWDPGSSPRAWLWEWPGWAWPWESPWMGGLHTMPSELWECTLPFRRIWLSSSQSAQVTKPSGSLSMCISYGATNPGGMSSSRVMIFVTVASTQLSPSWNSTSSPTWKRKAAALLVSNPGVHRQRLNESASSASSRPLPMKTSLLSRRSPGAHGSVNSPLKIWWTAWQTNFTSAYATCSTPLTRKMSEPRSSSSSLSHCSTSW
mmetsp:Transcript_34190/g.73007  ORF Transcript_34190/g.73007 Transcript_34190/m.73007 type:complete len:257 (-) Transcript_34190:859-1629(-)